MATSDHSGPSGKTLDAICIVLFLAAVSAGCTTAKEKKAIYDEGYRTGFQMGKFAADLGNQKPKPADMPATPKPVEHRIKAKSGDYSLIDDSSDYIDAVTDGVRLHKKLVFTTCGCFLPENYIQTSSPVIKCLTKSGTMPIYVSGKREYRKLLMAFRPSTKDLLVVSGIIWDLMVTSSTDRYTGKTHEEDKAPVVRVLDVEETGEPCYKP